MGRLSGTHARQETEHHEGHGEEPSDEPDRAIDMDLASLQKLNVDYANGTGVSVPHSRNGCITNKASIFEEDALSLCRNADPTRDTMVKI